MRYIGEDIEHVIRESVKKDLRRGAWWKVEDYELGRSQEGFRYVVAPRDYLHGRTEARWRKYQPLVSYPGLFLNFARLEDRLEPPPPEPLAPDESSVITIHLHFYEDTDRNARLALKWARTYGVLGLTFYGEGYDRLGDFWGGDKDTVVAFCDEVRLANSALTLYEAATIPNGLPDTETIADYFGYTEDVERILQDPEFARRKALEDVGRLVEWKVGENCYPLLFREEGRLSQGWEFRNLLGAMWLEMMWLVTSKEAYPRCQYSGCNRIIRYEKPQQPNIDPGFKKNYRGRYRKRKDAKFCSTNCRVKHWQHAKKANG